MPLRASRNRLKKRRLSVASSTLLYQTPACRQLLEEAMQYEGMGEPLVDVCADKDILEKVASYDSPFTAD